MCVCVLRVCHKEPCGSLSERTRPILSSTHSHSTHQHVEGPHGPARAGIEQWKVCGMTDDRDAAPHIDLPREHVRGAIGAEEDGGASPHLRIGLGSGGSLVNYTSQVSFTSATKETQLTSMASMSSSAVWTRQVPPAEGPGSCCCCLLLPPPPPLAAAIAIN